MKRLLLLAHAETDWNRAGRYQGHADPPLSAAGIRQAEALARRLADEEIDLCVTSDLQRAYDTASAIAARHELSPRCEPRLRELSFGAWEGLTYAEVQRRHPVDLAAWEQAPEQQRPPGGETLASLACRVGTVFEELNATATPPTTAIVAHRGSLRVLLCLALGLGPALQRRFHLEPASLSVVYLEPAGSTVSLWNDTSHLREAGHAR